MRTLPLHHSQREIYACDDYADFELALRPTYDFYIWGTERSVYESVG